jgi:hypothetical protein
LGAPTTSAKKTLTAVRLAAIGEDLRVPTINAIKRQWRPTWEAVPEVWERPPPMLKTSIAGPLAGAGGDLGVPTINAKNIDGGPPGPRGRGPVHIRHPKVLMYTCKGMIGKK